MNVDRIELARKKTNQFRAYNMHTVRLKISGLDSIKLRAGNIV